MAILFRAGSQCAFFMSLDNNGMGVSLEELQSLVGGYIEVLPLKRTFEHNGETYSMLVCNENGKCENLPLNERATHLLSGTGNLLPNDYLVGDVLLLKAIELQ